MGEFLCGTEPADQMHHTGIGIFRHVAVVQQQLPGLMIRKIILQCVRAVDIDQGAAWQTLSGRMRIPLGTSRLFKPDMDFVSSFLQGQTQENRFPVLIPARVGEQ